MCRLLDKGLQPGAEEIKANMIQLLWLYNTHWFFFRSFKKNCATDFKWYMMWMDMSINAVITNLAMAIWREARPPKNIFQWGVF